MKKLLIYFAIETAIFVSLCSVVANATPGPIREQIAEIITGIAYAGLLAGMVVGGASLLELVAIFLKISTRNFHVLLISFLLAMFVMVLSYLTLKIDTLWIRVISISFIPVLSAVSLYYVIVKELESFRIQFAIAIVSAGLDSVIIFLVPLAI
ncbi:MAG: hypothetical protein PHR36_01485 [Patescibacteria group bacterium]|nr:hypothetical protein [Patescibacteria group bacterium]